jgi:4-carboxymuconolactone decarboxylase
MRTLMLVLVSATLCAPFATAQSSQKLPADVDAKSLSRLPYLTRADLDANGLRVFEEMNGKDATTPRTAPGAAVLYAPAVGEPFELLNQAARKISVGPRYFELSALIGARAFDQQYEWSAHELAAQRAGVEQPVIDAIKFHRALDGLPEKDATLIRFGRALFEQHKVDSALFTKVVEQFGKQGLIEVAITMGDYAMAGIILTAVDQQLPADRKPLLPPK